MKGQVGVWGQSAVEMNAWVGVTIGSVAQDTVAHGADVPGLGAEELVHDDDGEAARGGGERGGDD